MALHTELLIHKVAYDFFDLCTELPRNMPRDFKQSLGGKLRDEDIAITVLNYRANCAADKVPLELFRPAAPGRQQSSRPRAPGERPAQARARDQR